MSASIIGSNIRPNSGNNKQALETTPIRRVNINRHVSFRTSVAIARPVPHSSSFDDVHLLLQNWNGNPTANIAVTPREHSEQSNDGEERRHRVHLIPPALRHPKDQKLQYYIHYTLNNIQYTLCIIQYTLYTKHHTIYTICYTICNIHYTIYTVHYVLPVHYTL